MKNGNCSDAVAVLHPFGPSCFLSKLFEARMPRRISQRAALAVTQTSEANAPLPCALPRPDCAGAHWY